MGIELGPKRPRPFAEKVSKSMFGQWAALRLLEKGYVCQPASHQWNVLRIEPPLTIAEAEIDRAVEAVGEVLDAYPGIAPLLRDVTMRVGRQFTKGWAF